MLSFNLSFPPYKQFYCVLSKVEEIPLKVSLVRVPWQKEQITKPFIGPATSNLESFQNHVGFCIEFFTGALSLFAVLSLVFVTDTEYFLPYWQLSFSVCANIGIRANSPSM